MNEKFLVMERCEDEPSCSLITKEELVQRLNNGEFNNYAFLKNPPDLANFPSYSVFVFSGLVAIPQAQEKVTVWTI